MTTNLTIEQITAIATEAALAAVHAALQTVDLTETAAPVTAPVQTPVTCDDAAPAKVLTRSAWKAARLTSKGTVRKAFAGLTREQAFEQGLLPGYVLPTGAMRASLRAA